MLYCNLTIKVFSVRNDKYNLTWFGIQIQAVKKQIGLLGKKNKKTIWLSICKWDKRMFFIWQMVRLDWELANKYVTMARIFDY